jgi:hypothetical protein
MTKLVLYEGVNNTRVKIGYVSLDNGNMEFFSSTLGLVYYDKIKKILDETPQELLVITGERNGEYLGTWADRSQEKLYLMGLSQHFEEEDMEGKLFSSALKR